MNIAAHQKKKNEETKTGNRKAGEDRRLILKKLWAPLLRSFKGAARRKNRLCDGSARGNWDLGKVNSHFDPTQTGSGTASPC